MSDDTDQRQESLTEGFIGEGIEEIAGFKLRPFTFGSLTLCRKLNLTLFTRSGEADDIDEDEAVRQLSAFFWLQSQPVREVLSHVRAGTADEEIDVFAAESLPLHALPDLMRRISTISELASVATVDVVPRPAGDAEEGEPGNS